MAVEKTEMLTDAWPQCKMTLSGSMISSFTHRRVHIAAPHASKSEEHSAGVNWQHAGWTAATLMVTVSAGKFESRCLIARSNAGDV
jgi:hypothetical protein